MANLTLAQLRDAQKANPPKVVVIDGLERLELTPDVGTFAVPNPAWETAPGRFPGLERDAFKPLNIGPPPVTAAGLAPEGSLPLQASPTVPAAVPGGHGDENIGPRRFLEAEENHKTLAAAYVDLEIRAQLSLRAAATTGYCRIFPATFPSIADIPQAWKDEFWSCNSQWCHVEAAEPHPDFEANLLAVEAQDAPKKETPGC